MATNAHLVLSNLKRHLPGSCHGESRVFLQEYSDEFAFQFKSTQLGLAAAQTFDSGGCQSCSGTDSACACLEAWY